MKVGDLVKIKQSKDPRYLGKLAIVTYKGTWSVDIHIMNSNSTYQPRFGIDELEMISESR